MTWKILSLLGELAFTSCAFLLAFRVIGKRPGQDPVFDKYMTSLAAPYKVLGVMGVIAILFSIVDLVVFSR